jgi:hypothetical protein
MRLAAMRARFPLGLICAALSAQISACGSNEKAESGAEICEKVLSSFAAVPITPESQEQALERIELIRAEQERSFAQECDKIPGWREKFDAAYEEAKTATSVIFVDAVDAAPVDQQ